MKNKNFINIFLKNNHYFLNVLYLKLSSQGTTTTPFTHLHGLRSVDEVWWFVVDVVQVEDDALVVRV